jgi:hypothetical protein
VDLPPDFPVERIRFEGEEDDASGEHPSGGTATEPLTSNPCTSRAR